MTDIAIADCTTGKHTLRRMTRAEEDDLAVLRAANTANDVQRALVATSQHVLHAEYGVLLTDGMTRWPTLTAAEKDGLLLTTLRLLRLMLYPAARPADGG